MSNGGVAKGGPMPESRVAHRPNAGVRMKRSNERVDQALTAASTTSPVADDDADLKMHGSEKARHAREAIRARQPRGAFDARAIRELSQAAPTDPAQLRRTIRRSELRQIVPLADSTIYELERRGEFPQRFFLTARCVVGPVRSAGLAAKPAAGREQWDEEGADAGRAAKGVPTEQGERLAGRRLQGTVRLASLPLGAMRPVK